MAYIIAVNSTILTDSGGTCVCTDPRDPTCGSDPEYQSCLIGLNRDLVTATTAIAAFGSFFFGLVTNLPVALATGMGLNAYFTYQVVGFHGTRRVPYGLALTAVFVEGFIFIFLSLLGMRQWLVRMLPTSLKVAAACGIGLFLAEIGLSYSAGIGAITGASATPLDLAGCQPEYRDEFGECQSHKMQNPTVSNFFESTTLSCEEGLTKIRQIVVDRCILRWYSDDVPYVVQGEKRHDHRYLGRLHYLLAVSQLMLLETFI